MRNAVVRVVQPVLFLAIMALAGIGMARCASNAPISPSAAPLQRPPLAKAASRFAKPSSSAPPTDWDSFGYDLQRTGYNPDESAVGAGNVGSLKAVWSFNVGSNIVHEPVYAYGVDVHGHSTNILYGGSQYGSAIYAIDASTGGLIWTDQVPYMRFTCGRRLFKFSIGETPAIDRAKHLIYFADGHDQVHAADLATGKEAAGWPIKIADYRPDQNFMHGGMTYNPSNGLLYAVTGSTCDISPWYGRIVAIDTSGSKPQIVRTFYTMSGGPSRGGSGGGIWGPGGGSIDPSTNNVFVATGNADDAMGVSQHTQYAEQIIELPAQLNRILAHNYPTNIPQNGMNDFDFGATPLLFQPTGCPPMLAAINKSGVLELYDRNTIDHGPIQYIYMSVPSDVGDFVGVPAFDPVTNYVYVGLPTTEGIYSPGIAALSVESTCKLNPTPAWSVAFGPDGTADGKMSRRSPISIANGVVYISNFTEDTEFAFDAATGAQLWTVHLPGWGTSGTVVANGMVFVSSDDGTITAWALPDLAKKLRRGVVRSKYSIPVHRSPPATTWGPWN